MSGFIAVCIAGAFLPSVLWMANSIDGIRTAQRNRARAAERLADAFDQIARAIERR